jgi:hypothetical protein
MCRDYNRIVRESAVIPAEPLDKQKRRLYGHTGLYVRGLKRDEKVGALVDKLYAAMPWLEDADYATAYAWAELEFLALRVWAELDKQGVINSKGDARRLLDDHRKLRSTQNQLAIQLGMTPASRASIRAIANKDKEIDLVGIMAEAAAAEGRRAGRAVGARPA